MSSSSLLSVATFKKRETKQNKERRQKQTDFNTGRWIFPSVVAFLNKQMTTTKQQEQGRKDFCFFAFKNPLSELFSNLPSRNNVLRQYKGVQRGNLHQSLGPHILTFSPYFYSQRTLITELGQAPLLMSLEAQAAGTENS